MENPNQSVEIWDQCRKFFSVASDMELYSQGQFLLQHVIDLRNRVHIRLTNGNELSNADFNRDIYNDAVNLLKTVDEQIYQYAVPLYGCGHTIPISREP